MSLYMDRIMRSSACLTATSRPFASQSQAIEAGAWQMAQSGSILMMVLRALESLVCILAKGYLWVRRLFLFVSKAEV